MFGKDESERGEYIKQTVVATGVRDVRKRLKNYRKDYNCSEETKRFIDLVLNNISVLSKTEIVWDGSWRNCVILVRPDTVYATHAGDYFEKNQHATLTELLTYFLAHTETIFLNLCPTTLAEDLENEFM